MAIVERNTQVTFTFVDDDLATSTETVNFGGADIEDVRAWGTTYITSIMALTGAALTRYSITQTYIDNTYPVAQAGSDVENKGLLKFRTANGGSAQITIPGILESVLVNTGTVKGVYLDLANTAVAAVVAALVTGIGGVAPIGGSGFDLASLLDAYKVNRASLKSRGRKG